MKHIKKKFLHDQKVPDGAASIFANAVDTNNISKQELNKKLTKNHIAYVITDADHDWNVWIQNQ